MGVVTGGTLDGSPIQVSSEVIDEDTPSIHDGEAHPHGDVPQEDKPRTAIVAEYLAHGYVLSDPIIQKAVAFDRESQHRAHYTQCRTNIRHSSQKSTASLLDSCRSSTRSRNRQKHAPPSSKHRLAFSRKLPAHSRLLIAKSASRRKPTRRSALANHVRDDTYDRQLLGLTAHCADYDRILRSEFGQQARHFYTQTSNNIKSVHEEASRIAADKKQASGIASGALQTPGSGAAPVTTASSTSTVPASTSGVAPTSASTTAAATTSSGPVA